MRQWIPAVPQVPLRSFGTLAKIGNERYIISPFPNLPRNINAKVRELHSLKQELAELIPKKQAEIKELKAKYKDTVIGDVTVDQIYGGMRDIKALVTETSLLDANEVRFISCLSCVSER